MRAATTAERQGLRGDPQSLDLRLEERPDTLGVADPAQEPLRLAEVGGQREPGPRPRVPLGVPRSLD